MHLKPIGFVIIFSLFLLSFSLRVCRIYDKTEFLGDQGSAAAVIYEAWKDKQILLHGPAVSTGQYPGPVYYYLISPFLILSDFNPLTPAIFMAILGSAAAILIFLICVNLFDYITAAIIGILYSVSTLLIFSDRNLWNPTPIPFLTTLLIYLMLLFRKKQNKYHLFFMGLMCGALIQLHFSTIYTFLICLLFIVYPSKSEGRSGAYCFTVQKISFQHKVFKLSIFFLGFIIILFPYLIYEWNNGFSDVRSLVAMMLFSKTDESLLFSPGQNITEVLHKFISFTVFGLSVSLSFLIAICVLIYSLISKQRFIKFLGLWSIGGLIILSRYGSVIHNHYVLFLMPLPFLLTGNLISKLIKINAVYPAITLGALLIINNLIRIDFNDSGFKDIERTANAVNEIIKDTKEDPFSFTLISSRSFSDYHYRFYFNKYKKIPNLIYDNNYENLYLVCEKSPCPDLDEIKTKKSIDVMCYEHHCQIGYPPLILDKFSYQKILKLDQAEVFVFKRH